MLKKRQQHESDHDDAVQFFHASAADYQQKHYDPSERTFMTVRQERVLEFIDSLALPPGASVLDAGCGPGYLVEAFAVRGFRVFALDGAAGMLQAAEARVSAVSPIHAASFQQGDIEDLPYADESFDLVCSTGVIDYLPEDSKVLGEFRRVLRPGGHLVLPVTNAWSPVNWLNPLTERLKKTQWLRDPVNAFRARAGHPEIRPRHFLVRLHSPRALRASLSAAGFVLLDDIYFHFLPLPRPFDRLLLRPSIAISRRLERFGRSWVGPAAEGYLTLSRKPEG